MVLPVPTIRLLQVLFRNPLHSTLVDARCDKTGDGRACQKHDEETARLHCDDEGQVDIA